jgi:hypothetical protein
MLPLKARGSAEGTVIGKLDREKVLGDFRKVAGVKSAQ